MSVALPVPLIQPLQVLTVAVGAPGVTGVIAKVEARLQGRRGPRVLQPYHDLGKLFRKEALAPEGASWRASGRSMHGSDGPHQASWSYIIERSRTGTSRRLLSRYSPPSRLGSKEVPVLGLRASTIYIPACVES